MPKLVVVNLDADTKRWESVRLRLGKHSPERFNATPGDIPDTYRRLCSKALTDGWDTDIIAMQDDIGFLSDIPVLCAAPITIYGYRWKRDGHVCPHAFAANAEGWAELAGVWNGRGRVCDRWRPIVESIGEVLNVTTHLEPVRQHDRTCPTGLTCHFLG